MHARSTEMPKKLVLLALVTAAAALAAGCIGGPTPPAPERLVLQTTTSVRDSALLDFILPDFEAKENAKVSVVAVGSGQALENSKRGDGDVTLVHSPAAEQAFMANGSGTARWQIMYNYYAIVGPAADPAGVRNAANASDAFLRIYTNASAFVSRGDNSGTNSKELSLWSALGLNASGFPSSWYKSIGKGMADALRTAFELEGYTLTDEGTYWSLPDVGANATAGGLSILLGGLADPTPDLKNTYSVIQLNASRLPSINARLAERFALWVTSPETAAMIGNFTAGGHQLFFPDPRRN
jgi:tungstate transport system substrate-binding protein